MGKVRVWVNDKTLKENGNGLLFLDYTKLRCFGDSTHDRAKKQEKEGRLSTKHNGIHYFRDAQGVYCELGEDLLEAFVPVDLDPVHIVKITFHQQFPAKPHRTLGLYVKGSARATLDSHTSSRILLKLKCQKLEDGQMLYRLIRAGKIQPEESWDQEEGGAA